MLVTISGLPGSGTSTVSRVVAERLGIERLDGGTVFRALATESGLSLAEFAQRAEADDRIDRDLDDRLTQRATDGDVVLESRLAGWLAHRAGLGGLKVWIACDEVERARRVGERDGHSADVALATNRIREASERQRYLGYYGLDLADLSVYDLVLDSTVTGPDDLIARIVDAAALVDGDQPA